MQDLNFKCPICGHNEYGDKKVRDFIGGIFNSKEISWVEYYYCEGCSVMFKDVEKFSASTKKEKKED